MNEREQFEAWAKGAGYDVAYTYDTERSREVWLNPMTADLRKAWQARAALSAPHADKVPAAEGASGPDFRQLLSDLRYAVNANPSCQAGVLERCRCLKCAMLRSYDALATPRAMINAAPPPPTQPKEPSK